MRRGQVKLFEIEKSKSAVYKLKKYVKNMYHLIGGHATKSIREIKTPKAKDILLKAQKIFKKKINLVLIFKTTQTCFINK